MNLTVIVDDHCGNPRLRGEHGLSSCLETPRGRILFDTGMGWSLLHNMNELSIPVKSIDHIILSHGHYDHTWGLNQFLLRNSRVPVWAHELFDKQRYSNRLGEIKYNGTSLSRNIMNFKPIEDVTEILEGVWAIPVPSENREPDFVPVDNGLVVLDDNKEIVSDPMEDDISLLVKGRFGYSILSGCAHAGIVNIMKYISSLTGTDSFYSVIGGMHFKSQPDEFVRKCAAQMRDRFKVEKWFPNHCTGINSAFTLSDYLDNIEWAPSGKKIEI